ncbi:MAG: hypothetical protein HYV16_00430 [Gammaproteobacteria bacterium]|nr:hypothetical protein [Gammaproteobacteria bacterium]
MPKHNNALTPSAVSLAALPFVGRLRDAQGRHARCCWVVRPSGDYTADGATGHAYARAFLAWLHQTGFTPALGWIIAAMQARGDEADAGLRAAFLDEVARHAFAGFGVIGAAAGAQEVPPCRMH